LSFFQESLRYDATRGSGLEFLRRTYSKYMPAAGGDADVSDAAGGKPEADISSKVDGEPAGSVRGV
jgi:hypothetical protein